MTATPALTADLQRQVLLLEDDLRTRVAADTDLEGRWKQEHHRAVEKERTAASWVTWRDDRVTQAAVAWVLTSVFIRFCEDNALVKPVWIAGPRTRRQEALDAQLAFFRQKEHEEDTDREWLEDAIDYLRKLPATRALVDEHSALHLVSPSGDAVTALLDFWRRRGDDGALVHDLTDASLSTRFLGDLYQDLSLHAKQTYALLQTPVFVEEFILDRTLEPALKERPLDGFKLIDPTCGSGHFLLGAFDRLLDRWHRHAPGLELQARVQAALDAIHGVDLNPFAVAIARFRLTVAALKACGLSSLEAAPAFTFHLATGDSLIHGPDRDVLPGMGDRTAYMPFTYPTEDGPLLLTLLEEGRYDVVVGNPPYIQARDKALNKIYRSKYPHVCKGKYALTVPFMALFFALAKDKERAGWVGQITSNSFMKREFGSKLVEDFLPHIDLVYVIDSEGAWIPGHNSDGTPTVIIVGRNQEPILPFVRAVLSKEKRETRAHGDEGRGPYWSSIVDHIDDRNWEDDWITITDLDRNLLFTHPWSLSGGGVVDLLAKITASRATLAQLCKSVGITSFTLEDDVYISQPSAFTTRGIRRDIRQMILGDCVRNWLILDPPLAIFPYDDELRAIDVEENKPLWKWMWPYRTNLSNNVLFGGQTKVSAGLRWTEYGRLTVSKLLTPLSITFSEVSTHNNFVLDRGGKIYNRTAPVIKLSADATEEDHLALLGALNSSTACFWLRQMSKAKGGAAEYPWLRTYQFNATRVAGCPLPQQFPLAHCRVVDSLAQEQSALHPSRIVLNEVPSAEMLNKARRTYETIRGQMVAAQEELDWEVYRLYGLIDEDLTYHAEHLPSLDPAERAFAIQMARAIRRGERDATWFTHKDHRYVLITDTPNHWPQAYSNLVSRRLEVIKTHPVVRLLERPEYKRRWESQPWDKLQERALYLWLLDRLEDRRFWFDIQGRPLPRSVSQLADDVARDAGLMSILALWEGRPDLPMTRSLVRLLIAEAVPFLAAYRYKESGLRKREAWEETWALQRREDAGEKVGPIPVPPRYEDRDFSTPTFARMRGKLDMPKERFILYPEAGRETDPTPLLGWAGWDHAQQSLALSLIIGEREKDGWDDERLVPLVAGLAELQPWVEQWHGEVDTAYGVSLAAFCREQLTARAAQVGKTLPELAAWRPEPPTRGRRSRRSE